MTRFNNTRSYFALLSCLSLLAVAGCKTAEAPGLGKAVDSLTGHHDATEARLSTAAANAITEGRTEEALAYYKKLYSFPNVGFLKTSSAPSQDVAVNYAQLLRRTGQAEEAKKVLDPFMTDFKGRARDNIDPIVLNEYAAALTELGELDKAEELLNRVLEDTKAENFHADAYNLLGVVLDAKGQHAEAEQAFRQALTTWKGDSTSVMNNLGLCLAGEGLFDQSLMTLRQALVMAPHKQEIARNIQMVENLRKSVVPSAPIRLKK